MNEVLKFLADNKIFYVATVDGDKPKVRPFAFVMEFEGKLYFGTNEQKNSFKQLKANPNVEICTTSPNNEWVRISGQAIFDYRPEVKEKAFEIAPYLSGMYGAPNSPVLALFYLAEGEATFASFQAAPKTVKL
jgi:uncharacterized pyridoxamine 5'-phosphate oxidase family protein